MVQKSEDLFDNYYNITFKILFDDLGPDKDRAELL